MRLSDRSLALALLAITPALWGVNALIARKAAGVIEPHQLALWRWLIAACLFAASSRRELWAHRHTIVADWKHSLVLGALGMWICGAWVYLGGRTTSATNIGLIYSLSPVLIVLASTLWLGERFSLRQAVGVALALTGVLHVVFKGQWQTLLSIKFVPGDGWILACTVSWAAYSLLLRKWESPLSLGARLGVISLAGAIINLPFAIWEACTLPTPAFSLAGGSLALIAAVLPGYIASWAYSYMQQVLGAARVSVLMYVTPIYVAGMAWLILSEPLQLYHLVGMALVLPGTYLVTRKPAS